jgi:hypothetical protein
VTQRAERLEHQASALRPLRRDASFEVALVDVLDTSDVELSYFGRFAL